MLTDISNFSIGYVVLPSRLKIHDSDYPYSIYNFTTSDKWQGINQAYTCYIPDLLFLLMPNYIIVSLKQVLNKLNSQAVLQA